MTTHHDAVDDVLPRRQTTRSRYASTQEHYVAAREIMDDVLCLAPLGGDSAETARTRARGSRIRPDRDYRAILEVSSVNYALKSEGEQEAITVSYQAFLNALAFPVQVLVRVVRLDLAPYLARLESINAHHGMAGHPAPPIDLVTGSLDDKPDTASHHGAPPPTPAQIVWRRLAHDHARFVRDLAMRRTLLERRFFVVVPADATVASAARSHQATPGIGTRGVSVSRFLPGHHRRLRRAAEEQMAKARQQLNLRCGELIRQLERMGLEARRLQGPELANLYYSCLAPTRAARHPLPVSVVACGGPLAEVGQMTQMTHPHHEIRGGVHPHAADVDDVGDRSQEGASQP